MGVYRCHAASDGGEAETVHQQMVIALIPKPAVIREAHHHMAIQRRAAAGAQIARQIDVHQRARSGFGVRRRRQIDKFRLVHRQRVIPPLHRHAVAFRKTQAQHVHLAQAPEDGLQQEFHGDGAVEFDGVGHRVGIAMRGNLIGDPDAGLRRDQRPFARKRRAAERVRGV